MFGMVDTRGWGNIEDWFGELCFFVGRKSRAFEEIELPLASLIFFIYYFIFYFNGAFYVSLPGAIYPFSTSFHNYLELS